MFCIQEIFEFIWSFPQQNSAISVAHFRVICYLQTRIYFLEGGKALFKANGVVMCLLSGVAK
jgi:hypothetical protein